MDSSLANFMRINTLILSDLVLFKWISSLANFMRINTLILSNLVLFRWIVL